MAISLYSLTPVAKPSPQTGFNRPNVTAIGEEGRFIIQRQGPNFLNHLVYPGQSINDNALGNLVRWQHGRFTGNPFPNGLRPTAKRVKNSHIMVLTYSGQKCCSLIHNALIIHENGRLPVQLYDHLAVVSY